MNKKLSLITVPFLALPFLVSCGEPKEFFVTFETYGGSHVATQRVKDGEKAVKPELPTRGEDDFKGWYIDTEFKTAYTFDEAVKNDITLYANWGQAPMPSTSWYLDTDYLNSLKPEDVNANGGVTQVIPVNGKLHKVRLIGVDHDELADDSGNKAHTTWEFVNYISDSNGYSIATPWNWKFGETSIAQDYPNSNLRKALDGQGNGEIAWYEKGSPTKSTAYTTSVLDMLPKDLQGVLKEVKKDVAIGPNMTVKSFNTKLFPLSYREMTTATDTQAAEEGTTYARYKGMIQDKDIRRLKHQVKWQEGAATDSTVITDTGYEFTEADNFAGFNSNQQEVYGGYCWLRSPVTTSTASSAFQLSVGGSFLKYQVYMYTLAVAPAFCL